MSGATHFTRSVSTSGQSQVAAVPLAPLGAGGLTVPQSAAMHIDAAKSFLKRKLKGQAQQAVFVTEKATV